MNRCRPAFTYALLVALLLASFPRAVQAAVVTAGTFPVYLAQFFTGLGGTTGQVLTVQSDGSVDFAAAAGGDLTAVTETGDALTITGGTGPTPDFAAQANVEALADAGALAAGNTLYSTGATNLTRLAIGTAGQVLTVNAGATAPEWAAASSSAKPYLIFDVRDGYNFPGASGVAGAQAFAAHSTRNGHHVLEFLASEETSADNGSLFQGDMPDSYAAGTLNVVLTWAAEGATSGNVIWLVSWERVGTALDIDGDSFAATQTVTTACSGTDGILVRSTIAFTQAQADAIAAGEAFRLFVVRDADNASDTLAVRCQLVSVTVEEQ